MSQTRRLAAIMFTDVVRYTAMMGDDDGGHLVPKAELMKHSLIWFDKYLGAVK